MTFHDREYDVRFWAGKPDGAPPWVSARWTDLRPAFDGIARAGRLPLKIRTSQIDNQTGKHVRFGRLGWSVESDGKWLLAADDSRYFENLEFWAPDPTVCSREGRSPDVYFDVTSLQGAGGFQWIVVAAIACEIGEPQRAGLLSALDDRVAEQFPRHVSAAARRPWGYAFGSGFDNGMQELSDDVAFRLRQGAGELDLTKLAGAWHQTNGAAGVLPHSDGSPG